MCKLTVEVFLDTLFSWFWWFWSVTPEFQFSLCQKLSVQVFNTYIHTNTYKWKLSPVFQIGVPSSCSDTSNLNVLLPPQTSIPTRPVTTRQNWASYPGFLPLVLTPPARRYPSAPVDSVSEAVWSLLGLSHFSPCLPCLAPLIRIFSYGQGKL